MYWRSDHEKQKIYCIYNVIFCLGSGQFFICRQRIKGLVIFALQALVVGIELGTGYWLEYLTGQFTDFSLRLHGGFFS